MMWYDSRLQMRVLWGLFFPLVLILPSVRGLIVVAAIWPVSMICIHFAKHQYHTLTSGDTDHVKLAALVGGQFALLGTVIYMAGLGLSRIMLWLAAQKIAGLVTAAVIATMSLTISHTLARTLLDQTAQADTAIWSDTDPLF